MRPASVGFQCPECVAEGARTQRAARTVAGGRVPRNPGRATMVLIGLNVAVFLLVLGTGGGSSRLALDFVMLPESWPRLGLTGVDDGAWWRLLTSAFLHTQVLHIALNMIALYALGPALERLVGHGRFVAVYLTTALAGSVTVLWLGGPRDFTLGASGAVFGIFGAAIVLMRSRGYDIQSLAVVLGINLVLTFTLDVISWQAHLGGLVTGLVLGAVLAYTPRARRRLVHPAVFAATTVLLLGLVGLHVAV